jgi:deazaflavin-dependent oxidoreductase (nitroreductase family)
MLFGAEHVKRYRETGGQEGHDWEGTTTLILTTTGRRSGEQRSTPLIYREAGDGVFTVVASNGGGSEPAWFLNIADNPEVTVQVWDDEFVAKARVADASEKPALWRDLVATWPAYEEYQEKATREIPVVLLDRNTAQSVD